MEEPAAKPKEKKEPRSRSPLLILFGLVAILAAVGLLVAGILRQQEQNDRLDAEQHLNALLNQARAAGAEYVRDRDRQRTDTARRLARQADTVCADVQVFLQAAVIRREAENNARLLASIKKKRDRLVALIRQQAAVIDKITANIAATSSASITTIQPVTPGITPTTDPTIPSATGIVQNDTGMPSDPTPDLVRELQSAQERHRKLVAQLDAGPDETEAALASDQHWPEQLLRECGADLESLLPENCAFSAAEAGGRLLLALGGGKASPDEVRAEASRSLLLQAQGKNLQWVIRVVLADPDAPARPNPRELAGILAERLGLSAAQTPDVTGWVLNEKGIAEAGFPAAASADLPDDNLRPGVWFPVPGGMLLLNQTAPLAPALWPVAIQLRLPHQPLQQRAELFFRAHPLYAGGLLAAGILLLGGILTLTILATRSGVRMVALTAAPGSSAPVPGAVRPVLGSLERLQRANRGRTGGGSRILELARSSVLRELAGRIRQQTKDNPKISTRTSSAALREYRK